MKDVHIFVVKDPENTFMMEINLRTPFKYLRNLTSEIYRYHDGLR